MITIQAVPHTHLAARNVTAGTTHDPVCPDIFKQSFSKLLLHIKDSSAKKHIRIFMGFRLIQNIFLLFNYGFRF